MAYAARFSKSFIKRFEKLPDDIKPRVIEAVKELLVNPYIGVPLVGPLKGLWRTQIGKYRIIYEINEKEKNVVFHKVDLRKRIYD
ncbi:MAG: type II toxin-antitoxin system RelE family toxin [Thermoproteota archaeon]